MKLHAKITAIKLNHHLQQTSRPHKNEVKQLVICIVSDLEPAHLGCPGEKAVNKFVRKNDQAITRLIVMLQSVP